MKIAKKGVIERDGQVVGVYFAWADEERTEVFFDDLHPDMRLSLMAHGLLQKLGDSYSGSKGVLEKARAMFHVVLQAILNNQWSVRSSSFGVLGEALQELTGQPMEKVIETMEALGKEWRAELRKRADVSLKIKEIELRKAKEKAEKADGLDNLTDMFDKD